MNIATLWRARGTGRTWEQASAVSGNYSCSRVSWVVDVSYGVRSRIETEADLPQEWSSPRQPGRYQEIWPEPGRERENSYMPTTGSQVTFWELL